MFKSSRKNNSNIISDIVSSSFGFGTRKDRIDRALENHEKVTINKTNHSIANR